MVKTVSIQVRVPASMKAALKSLADKRLTTESEIGREAIIEYLAKRDITVDQLRAPPVTYKSTPSGQKDTVHKARERIRKRAGQVRAPAPEHE
jgi:hypothetical protein